MAQLIPRFLRQLRDVLITSPADGDALVYDSGSGKWKNDTVSGGGGGPPTGAAGGVLGGTFPDPDFAVDMATQAELDTAIAALSSAYQPLDSDLTALAALSTTSFGRALLTAADAAALRTAAALGTAATSATGDFDSSGAAASAQAASQPLDSDLTAIAALTTTTFGRSFLALADAAAGRTALGLGTASVAASGDFDAAGAAAAAQSASQPLDSDLTAIAALSTTSYGRALLALADAAALRTAAGLGTAAVAATSDFDATGAAAAAQAASQPLDSDLTAIAALTTTSFGRALLASADAAALRSAAGLGTAAVAATSDFDAAGAAAAAQAASQPVDSDLTAIAALTTTSFGRGLLALADAAAGRTALGLGTLSTQSGTFSGTSSGTNTGDQTSVSGNAGTATALQTARAIDGQSFDGTAAITVIAPGTHAASGKTTPVDADEFALVDSAASNVLKKLTWANLKAGLPGGGALVLLSTTTGASLDVSGISGSYNDLVVQIIARSAAGSLTDNLSMLINNDSSAHYAHQYVLGNSTSVSASEGNSTSAVRCGTVPGSTANSGCFGIITLEFPGYSSTAWQKLFFARYAFQTDITSGNHSVYSLAGVWNQTTVISRLAITNSLHASSTIRVYGRL